MEAALTAVSEDQNALQQTVSDLTSIQRQLQKTTAYLEQKQGQIKAEIDQLPECPLRIWFERPLLLPGLVLAMKNESVKTFEGKLVVSKADSGDQKTYNLKIPAMTVMRLDASDGWRFTKGGKQKLVISSEGFLDLVQEY